MGGEAAFSELELDVVTFMPAGSPWQKTAGDVTPASHRWEMTVLATDGIEYFEPDDREVRRPGWTYTMDTLESLDHGDDVVLIVGADAAIGLSTWHRARDVLDRVNLAVIPRPGVERSVVDRVLGDYHWLDVPELPLSGSMLRRRAQDGVSIKFLVPALVHEYLTLHRLYG